MTILVTGAAGFIGYSVARALIVRGEAVVGIDNRLPYYDVGLKAARVAALQAMGGYRDLMVDFADRAALETALAGITITRIVHLGAQPGVRWSIDHPQDYGTSNLVGQLNLLELARARQVPMVYASSSSVYGGQAKLPSAVGDPVDQPVSLYAATKRSGELMAESYAHLYRIPLTGLRFFTVYGPWGRPDMAVWLFTEAAFDGREIAIHGHGDMRRDFTYVDDIVAGVLACLDRPPADDGTVKPGGSLAPHAIYNIGNNRAEELLRLVAVVEAATGHRLKTRLLPIQPGEVRETCADIAPIARDMGFAPKTPIDEGIPRFVDWYRGWRARRG